MKQEEQSGAAAASTSQRTGAQQLDARYGEEPHVITDRLRTTMANAAQRRLHRDRQEAGRLAVPVVDGRSGKVQELAKVAGSLCSPASNANKHSPRRGNGRGQLRLAPFLRQRNVHT
jgi:hypothetical protein